MVERGGEMVSIKLEITAIKKFNSDCVRGEISSTAENPQPAHGYIFLHMKISNAGMKAGFK